MNHLEKIFESVIWSSRFIIIAPVIAGIFIAIGLFYMASVDAVILLNKLFGYANPSITDEVRSATKILAVTYTVQIIDNYLLATIMLIFSFGLYELFISKIDIAEKSEVATRVLLIQNLDDLKNRLAKVILLVLIVTFFKFALGMQFNTAQDILFLGIGIVLISGAIYLSHKKEGH
jgi:uncharacterized membrane protein YqhA